MVYIVSAYYKIPSKAEHETYMNYMEIYFNLLSHIPKIFFCEELIKNEIIQRFNPENIEFIILNFIDLPILKKISHDIWKKHLQYDIERYHTPELGIIWSSKKDFVLEASKLYPEEKWFCWVDAGCIRTLQWGNFTQELFTRLDYRTLTPGIYLQKISNLEEDQLFKIFPFKSIAGGIILFHKKYIEDYISLYSSVLELYIANRISITMDQYIMASIIINYNPQYIYNIDYITELDVPDKWWFFLGYL